jgi:peptidoglycan/xylan/chitin deacetylase (PgdA/CDA1 family)
MYHLIAAPPENAQYPELYVRPAVFARQMRYLHDQGYKAVTLRQVVNAWQAKGALPRKPVVVSFDDGYPSHYQTAAPIMEAYGWVGLLNADWNVLEKSSRLAAQVKLLATAGWEIGSHSLTHPDLATLDAAALEQEVAGSRRTLEKELGVEIETFCYPAGRYDDTVVAAVEAAGYASATTTDPGLAVESELYRLKRIRVNGSTTLPQFAGMLRQP